MLLLCESNKTMQIKTRGGGFLEKGEIFHSKSHAKFLLLRNFYKLEFHHNLFVYMFLRLCDFSMIMV